MAVSEETRYHLYQRLEAVLGAEDASTLMEHLPPVGWADVATKRDIDVLGTATKRDIDALRTETRLGIESLGNRFDARLERELRLLTWRLMVAMITMLSVVVAVVRL